MSENQTPMAPEPIHFTDAAVAKVKTLIEEEGNDKLKLRVFVQGGGCGGFNTVFSLMKTSTKTMPRWSKTA